MDQFEEDKLLQELADVYAAIYEETKKPKAKKPKAKKTEKEKKAPPVFFNKDLKDRLKVDCDD